MNSKTWAMENFTKGSGTRELVKERGSGFSSGPMDLSTKDSGSTARPMEEAG